MSRIPVVIVIKGLGAGGAERLIVNGLAHADRDRFVYEVAYVLDHKDALVPELEAMGVPTHALHGAQDPRWTLRLRRILGRAEARVIHAHLPTAAVGARLAVSGLGAARLVYTEHNEWSSYRLPTRVANAVTFAQNDHVFAVSEQVRRSIRYPSAIRAFPMPPVETLYHGVDVPAEVPQSAIRKELAIQADAPMVVTVANLRRGKGHDTLLRSAVEVRRQIPDACFVLVGAGPLEPEVRRLAGELGLNGTIRFAGYRRDAVSVAAAADVFALASDFEGLPIALLEAMSLGVPCVATSVGGVPEVIRNEVDGLLVGPRSPHGLADAIVRSLRDADLRSRLAAAGPRRAELFDLGQAVRRMEKLYEELAE